MHNLLLANFAVIVQVKDAKGLPASVLLVIDLLVQRCGQELRVVYDTAAVGIDVLHDLLQVGGDLLEPGLGEEAFISITVSRPSPLPSSCMKVSRSALIC